MGFTTPCFIRKNTEELRKKLEDLGYNLAYGRCIDCSCLATSAFHGQYMSIAEEIYDSTNPHITYNCANRKDCGTNEELFLAIAALRDDSNYMQWFITDSPLSVSYDDSIGNDHYFTEPKGSMFFWDENWNHATIISGSYHKATVEELINHFDNKC